MFKIMNKMRKCDRSFNRFKINLEVTALNISKKLGGNHTEKISFTTEL
jgi:hypothetical protein